MRTNQLFIEFKNELLKIKDKKKFEKAYYEKLRKCLKAGQFKAFELLFNASVDFNIFLDIKKIPDRFSIISKLLLNCIDKVSNGYQTSALGEVIEILRFCMKYNLLEKQLNVLEKKILENLKKETLFLANLNDLFGIVSNSFILYVYNVMPQDLYNHFITSPISFFPDRDELVHYIKNIFFDQYTIYGLSIRNISSIDDFIKVFKENYPYNENQFKKKKELLIGKGKELIEFYVTYKYRMFYYDTEEEQEHHEIKKHLVSPKNILKNINKILMKKNYNFYSLSMVLLGGLGPQGLGFTYSTPKGEVIEICSDQKESEAIIIKYKQYLKRKFMLKLEKELENFRIDEKVKYKIIKFLSDILNQNELINYSKKNSILRKIKTFLEQLEEFQEGGMNELQELINEISNAISIILRRIKLRDQFITRMDLVVKDKIKSEDIAKLTSLKGKSHYDVLRERFFFQNIIKWFYEIYKNKKIKIENW
ncbi:MAG: hypothetical protein HWN81_03915 [Candidatus Lokiarchaeota archaeon]|nr:hypothetical protein [Candidatus Lokiarchaeota archaeon]